MAGAGATAKRRRRGKVEKGTVDGERAAELRQKNTVVNLSQHSYVDHAGIIRTLTCNCSPMKPAQ